LRVGRANAVHAVESVIGSCVHWSTGSGDGGADDRGGLYCVAVRWCHVDRVRDALVGKNRVGDASCGYGVAVGRNRICWIGSIVHGAERQGGCGAGARCGVAGKRCIAWDGNTPCDGNTTQWELLNGGVRRGCRDTAVQTGGIVAGCIDCWVAIGSVGVWTHGRWCCQRNALGLVLVRRARLQRSNGGTVIGIELGDRSIVRHRRAKPLRVITGGWHGGDDGLGHTCGEHGSHRWWVLAVAAVVARHGAVGRRYRGDGDGASDGHWCTDGISRRCRFARAAAVVPLERIGVVRAEGQHTKDTAGGKEPSQLQELREDSVWDGCANWLRHTVFSLREILDWRFPTGDFRSRIRRRTIS